MKYWNFSEVVEWVYVLHSASYTAVAAGLHETLNLQWLHVSCLLGCRPTCTSLHVTTCRLSVVRAALAQRRASVGHAGTTLSQRKSGMGSGVSVSSPEQVSCDRTGPGLPRISPRPAPGSYHIDCRAEEGWCCKVSDTASQPHATMSASPAAVGTDAVLFVGAAGSATVALAAAATLVSYCCCWGYWCSAFVATCFSRWLLLLSSLLFLYPGTIPLISP